MLDFFKELSQARPDTLLILFGLVFLAVAVFGDISGKIQPGKQGRIASAVLGPALVAVGLWMHGSHSPLDEAADKRSALSSITTIADVHNAPKDAPPSQAARSRKFSLVGTWTGSQDCTMVFYKDDGKNIEGSCDNAGFIHRFTGAYSDPENINISINRIDRKTKCETQVTGYIKIIGQHNIEVGQLGWNGCGVTTANARTEMSR